MEKLFKNCIACRMGYDVWHKKKGGEFVHFDFFATPEAGAIYECSNKDVIGYYLEDNSNNNLYSPKKEYKNIFSDQNYWWEDIQNIIKSILDIDPSSNVWNDHMHKDYLNKTSNKMLENSIIVLAKSYKIDISPEKYPDLLIWNNKIGIIKSE